MKRSKLRSRSADKSEDVPNCEIESFNQEELTFPGLKRSRNIDEDTEDDLDITRTRRRLSDFGSRTDFKAEMRRLDGAPVQSVETSGKKRRHRSLKRHRNANRSMETSKYPERSSGNITIKSQRSPESAEAVGSERSRKRKKRIQDEGGSSKEVELPITEILKKAQENNRTRYEQKPISLDALTPDRIYVQGRRGFRAVKIAGGRFVNRKKLEESKGSHFHPVRIAIMVQKAWKCMGFIFQGLLAGMALMHFILIETYFNKSFRFFLDYSLIAEIYTNIFTFMMIMSLIATFDKFDLAHLDGEHLREMYINEAKSVVAIPLYLIAFCLHQVSLKVEDKLSLMYYNANDGSINGSVFGNFSNPQQVPLDEMSSWQRITLSKDLLVVLAWLFVSLGTQDDLLVIHLEAMNRYAEDPQTTM